jgi:hypothetical protein
MTLQDHLSDRIPEIAHGRSSWTPAEAAHLAECADCRAELELVRATLRMADRAPVVGDPESITRQVLTRLAADGRARRRSRWAWGLGTAAAAAAAIAVWGGGDRSPAPPASVGAEFALPELEPLETAELDSLLQTMDAQSPAWSALDEPSLGDLEADELEQVLGTWEG